MVIFLVFAAGFTGNRCTGQNDDAISIDNDNFGYDDNLFNSDVKNSFDYKNDNEFLLNKDEQHSKYEFFESIAKKSFIFRKSAQ